MEETNFVGICEPKSELSEFISGDISDLENDPLYDPDQSEKSERNKQKRIRSKQNTSGSQKRAKLAMRKQGFGFVCPQCDKDFAKEDHLNIHKFVEHEGNKPFVCGFCKVNFMINEALTSHVKELHKKFKCEKCNDSSYYNR